MSTCYLPVKQRGFTLLEAIITLIVVAVGLLGQAALMAQAAKSNNTAYYRSMATLLAADYLERMRVNYVSAMQGNYSISAGSAAPSSPNTLPNYEKKDWLGKVAATLPGGAAQVTTTTLSNLNGTVTSASVAITITWNEVIKGDNGSGGVVTTSFVTNSVI